jgi:esterase
VKLHVEDDGPRDGAPVVFLHGVSGSGLTYGWLPEEIVSGRRILRPDLRGHGRSAHAPGTYVIERYTEDVVALLRETVDRPAVLVGHSLGGVVAWSIAQRHPELVAAVFLEDPPLYRGEVAEHETNAAVPIFRVLIALAARWHAGGVSPQDAATELAAAPMGRDTCDDAHVARAHALLAMDPGVLEQAGDRSTLADTDTASPVTVPALLLAADDAMAAFTIRHGERLARTHPDVEIERITGAPHGIHHSRAYRGAYVEHLTRFLATHA